MRNYSFIGINVIDPHSLELVRLTQVSVFMSVSFPYNRANAKDKPADKDQKLEAQGVWPLVHDSYFYLYVQLVCAEHDERNRRLALSQNSSSFLWNHNEFALCLNSYDNCSNCQKL